MEPKDKEALEEEEGERPSTMRKPKPVVTGILGEEQVLTEESDTARDLYNQGRFPPLPHKSHHTTVEETSGREG